MPEIKNIQLPKQATPFKQESGNTKEEVKKNSEGTCDTDPGYSSMMNLYSEKFTKQLSEIDHHQQSSSHGLQHLQYRIKTQLESYLEMYKHVGSLQPEISTTGQLSSAVGDQIPKTADLSFMIHQDWNQVRNLRMTKILWDTSDDGSLERLKVSLSNNDFLDSKAGTAGISFPKIVDLGDEKIS